MINKGANQLISTFRRFLRVDLWALPPIHAVAICPAAGSVRCLCLFLFYLQDERDRILSKVTHIDYMYNMSKFAHHGFQPVVRCAHRVLEHCNYNPDTPIDQQHTSTIQRSHDGAGICPLSPGWSFHDYPMHVPPAIFRLPPSAALPAWLAAWLLTADSTPHRYE